MRVAWKKDRLSLRALAAERVARLAWGRSRRGEQEVPGCVWRDVRDAQTEAETVADCAPHFQGQTGRLICAAPTEAAGWYLVHFILYIKLNFKNILLDELFMKINGFRARDD